MKKIISFLIILSIFAISCMNTAMASFEMLGGETMMMKMQHSTMMNTSNHCKKNQHECCIYPFNDASTVSNIHTKNNNEKLKSKMLDFNFSDTFQSELQKNCLEKLTSPPDKTETKILKNIYINLTGIIKNNN